MMKKFSNRRSLRLESLEDRRLFAVDVDVTSTKLEVKEPIDKQLIVAEDLLSKQGSPTDEGESGKSTTISTDVKLRPSSLTSSNAGEATPDHVYEEDGIHFWTSKGKTWAIEVPAGTEVYNDGDNLALVFPNGDAITGTFGEDVVWKNFEEFVEPEPEMDESSEGDEEVQYGSQPDGYGDDGDDSFHWAWEDNGSDDSGSEDKSFHWAWEDDPESDDDTDSSDGDDDFHWAWEDDPSETDDDGDSDEDDPTGDGSTGYQDPNDDSSGGSRDGNPSVPRPGSGDIDPGRDDDTDGGEAPSIEGGSFGGLVTDPSSEDENSDNSGASFDGPTSDDLVTNPGPAGSSAQMSTNVKFLNPAFVDALLKGIGGVRQF